MNKLKVYFLQLAFELAENLLILRFLLCQIKCVQPFEFWFLLTNKKK